MNSEFRMQFLLSLQDYQGTRASVFHEKYLHALMMDAR